MNSTPMDHLKNWLDDPEYARAFGGEMAKSTFAVALSRARRNAGIKQAELAGRIGGSQPYVAKLESGEANPTLDKVGRILAALGLRLVAGTEPLDTGLEHDAADYRVPQRPLLLEDAGRTSPFALPVCDTAAGSSEEFTWRQTSQEVVVSVGGEA